jgi:glutathione S-transferase
MSKLYNFRWGPYPRRVAIYLAEKGIADIEQIDVEFPHRPELWPSNFLLDLNPAHSLPVLEAADGIRIGQSTAILEYLEETGVGPDMLGKTPAERALTREFVSIFDEATSFFGLWARQGSRVNADRHPSDAKAASFGAERFASKLRVAEAKLVGPFLGGAAITIADCVAMALIEFADQFYGVTLPADCPKLIQWYSRMSTRASTQAPNYPPDMLALARGLPEQTQIFI